MTRARNGWTLAEMLVVLALAAVVLLIVSSTLASTARLTNLESQRGFMQGQLETSLSRIEHGLQRSCVAGVAWLPPAPGQTGVLAIHPLEQRQVNSIRWEDRWMCFLWDPVRKELLLRECPPAPPNLTAPRIDRPQAATPAQMAQIGATVSTQRILLGGSVSLFDYRLEAGPVAHLTMELEVKVPQRVNLEKLRVDRSLFFRNRI